MENIEHIFYLDQLNETANLLLTGFETYRIFCFTGNLGAGKTTLISAICRQLGSNDLVNSPTFSIVNEYSTLNSKIYHFDLYRLNNLEEAMDIGFEEYIYSGNYCFIEWPEKVAEILPKPLAVHCELTYLGLNQRKLKAWVY